MRAANNKGSMTVEVTLTLMVFISLLLMLLAFSKLSILHGKVQFALNQTVKEISSYSYLYAASGAMDINNSMQNQLDSETIEIDQTAELILNLYSKLQALSDNTVRDFDANVMEIKEIYTDTTSLAENIKRLAKSPEKLFTSLLYLGYDESLYFLRSTIIRAIVEALLPKYLSTTLMNADDYLRSYGIESGIKGLNFSETSFLEDTESLEIVVKYQIVQKLPALKPLKLGIVQNASARVWLNGDKNRIVIDQPNNNSTTSVWNDKNYFRRGKKIIGTESRNFQYTIINTSGLHALNATENNMEIIRILSYDATKPTNELEQFSKVMSTHLAIMNKKISDLSQLVAEKNDTKERKLFGIGENLEIVKRLVVIVPENIESMEWKEMKDLSKEFEEKYHNLKIKLKKGYGASEAVGELKYDN